MTRPRRNSPPARVVRRFLHKVGEAMSVPCETTSREKVLDLAFSKPKSDSDKSAAEKKFGTDCLRYKLPPPIHQWTLEKRLQTPRKDGKAIPKVWRFDWCFVDYKLIVEINGGIWRPGGGAHSHPIDITRNMIKQNEAVLAGFHVLQFTPDEVKNENAVAFTIDVLYSRGWRR